MPAFLGGGPSGSDGGQPINPVKLSSTAIEYIDRTMQNADRFGGMGRAQISSRRPLENGGRLRPNRSRGLVCTLVMPMSDFTTMMATLARPRCPVSLLPTAAGFGQGIGPLRSTP